MKTVSRRNVVNKWVLGVFLFAIMLSFAFGGGVRAAENWNPGTEQAVLVVTGSGVVGGNPTAADLTAGIASEKAYTMEELKAMMGSEYYTYSSVNNSGTQRYYKARGVLLSDLFAGTAFTPDKYDDHAVKALASDGYSATLTSYGAARYLYDFAGVNGAVPAPAMLALESVYAQAPAIPADSQVVADAAAPRLIVGQLSVDDINNSLFNQYTQKLLVGSELPSILNAGGKSYARADLLLMPRITGSYTYSTQAADRTDFVMGVPLYLLLTGYNDSDEVEFVSADGYANPKVTVGDIRSDANQYVLAYASGADANSLTGIYDTAKNDPSIHGYLTVYAQGKSPVKMVTEIKVTSKGGIDFANSPFKHINNGGISGQNAPYNIDSITGATLTVEGPGMKASVPLSIRQVEEANGGAFRGDYTDYRPGATTMTYEGIRLLYILMDMKAAGVEMTSLATKVSIKDRVRQTVAEFTLAQIIEAELKGKPIIVAYGVSNGERTAPFVYDNSAGYVAALGNDDGCIKLVYDKSVVTGDTNASYTKFTNMAYIYVGEENIPGFKHDSAPYNTPENSQYVITLTGDKIGREINYTVAQLEAMVKYDANGRPTLDGMGWRAEYSLANNAYWYVNEYEGIKLWDLLLKVGVDQSDMNAPVTFRATDGYVDFDTFTLAQLKNPNLFGYYEKNAEDLNDGKFISVPEDLKSVGYPVLLAYGVNGYPYVIKNTLDGFKSGLGNDGGPMRVISGKMDYNHANGSKQAKLLDKIIVGNDVNYSTHKSNNTDPAYQALANQLLKVSVMGMDGNLIKNVNYTVAQIEDLIYGANVSNQEKQLARVKDFYSVTKGSSAYTDLYEGVNFRYFLENVVQIPGSKGTVDFILANGDKITLTLDELYALGGNSQSQKTGLATVLAFAKNGYPMVADKNAAGYVSSFKDGFGEDFDVKNDGGPLALILPEVGGKGVSALNVVEIVVNLQPDKYAHMEAPYNTLANTTITIGGEGTRLEAPRTFTLAELEGLQTLAFTGDYNIRNNAGVEEQTRYRGIDLYALLRSTEIGLRSNAYEVTIETADGMTMTFPLSALMKTDYLNGATGAQDLRMILAYGSASVTNANKEDGRPLVRASGDEGYDAAYKNSGGPLRLVVGQTDANDANSGKLLKDVVSITVTASEQTSWNHSSAPVYEQYLNETYTLRVVDLNRAVIWEKVYTLRELEAMGDLIVRDQYTYVGTHEEEGLDLWRFIQREAAAVSSIANPVMVNVFASDGYNRDLLSVFGMDALQNGIIDGDARKIIILSYARNGSPLVFDAASQGYVNGNDGGPVRLITHANQGSCLKDARVIEVVVSGGTVVEPAPDLTLKGSAFAKEIGFTMAQLKANPAAAAKNYKWFDRNLTPPNQVVTDAVGGVPLIELLRQNGITGNNYTVSFITSDGYSDNGNYLDIPLSAIIAGDYIVAFEVNGNPLAGDAIRVYRNLQAGTDNEPTDWRNRLTGIVAIEVKAVAPSYDFIFYPTDGSQADMPFAAVRCVVPDKQGGFWIGTNGAGAAYIAADGTVTRYTTSTTPALRTNFVHKIAIDAFGGVWLTQGGESTRPETWSGAAYLKDGAITFYDTSTAAFSDDYLNAVHIDKDGNVWFGGRFGVTKYDPAAGTFRSWTKADGLPLDWVDNIASDGKGGVWLGFIPEITQDGDGNDLFRTGGVVYIDASGKIHTDWFLIAEAGADDWTDTWVRSIAIDKDGGVWITSGAGTGRVGGRVHHIAPDGTYTHYTGHDIIPDLKKNYSSTAASNPEIRVVAIAPDGSLWFGTTSMGLYTGPDINSITVNYSGANGNWPEGGPNDSIWFITFDGKGGVYAGSNGGAIVKPGDGTEPVYHTVTFVDWDGAVLDRQTVEHGSGATAPADPARTGYTFLGWDKNFDNVIENLTVTALYEINTYTVTFVDWDGTVLDRQTVEEGSGATAPADPARTGYTFTGWDKNFDNITGDLTVTALYEEIVVPPAPDILITSVETGNGQANVNFDIKSANGKGYSVYISTDGGQTYTLYADLNYNSKGVHLKGLTNGQTYSVKIAYEENGTTFWSDAVSLTPSK